MTTAGRVEIGGAVDPEVLSCLLRDALRTLNEEGEVQVHPAGHPDGSLESAVDSALKEARVLQLLVDGLDDQRPFDMLRPAFAACREAGADCRVTVSGPNGVQAAYAKPGGQMLWIAFLLTPTGEVRYGPTSTYWPLAEGLSPSLSDWLEAAQALGETAPPLTLAGPS